MSGSSSPDGETNKLAKKILGYPETYSDTLLPKPFLKELKKHTSIFPDDTNFRIVAQPGAGFGYVVCLEQGCLGPAQQIELTQIDSDPAGSKKIGIGSLLKYRNHINNHPTHKMDRKARVSQNSGRTRQSSQDRFYGSESQDIKPRLKMLGVLDPKKPGSPLESQHSSSSPARLAAKEIFSMPDRVKKEEPEETTIPRKRLLDLLGDNGQKPHGSLPGTFGSSIIPKKIKTDENSAAIPNLSGPSFAAPPLRPSASRLPPELLKMISPKDARARLQEEKRKLTVLESTLAAQKASRQVREKRRIPETQRRINETRANIVDFQAALGNSATASDSSVASARRLSDSAGELTDWNSSSVPSSPALPLGSIGNKMEVDEKPDLSAVGATTIRLPPVAYPPAASSSRVQLPYGGALVPAGDLLPPADEMMEAIRRIQNTGAGGIRNAVFMDVDDDSDPEDPFDSQGNFYGRGADRYRGPVSSAGDLNSFISQANKEFFDSDCTISKAQEYLGLASLDTRFPRMTVCLLPHQTIGVAWMLQKERSPFKGGILADEMGLGKTVQTIAVLVANRSQDPAVKTTLIVAPLSLLDQWKTEIEDKTDNALKVMIYHGAGKTKNMQTLKKHDVILTTFGTLANEWPDYDALAKKEKQKSLKKSYNKRKAGDGFVVSDSDDDYKPKKKKLERGPLLRMKFYRIVLDEAQNVRNKRTRVSRAVSELSSEYRWCLTGTPIINSLDDAYGLFRFLQIRPWYDWEEFNNHIAKRSRKNPTVASNRLQAIFQTCLLRRKKDTLLNGQPLICLPPKEVELIKLDFSPEEREIYKMVELKSQQIFNKYLRAGTVLKNYASVLVLLLRLRQICSHTALITEDEEFDVDDNDDEDDHDGTHDAESAQRLLGPEFVRDLKEKLKAKALELMEAEKSHNEDARVDDECPICFDNFTSPVVTQCFHTFCKECITTVLKSAGDEAAGLQQDQRPCPQCRSPISPRLLFKRSAFEPTDAELGIKPEPFEDAKPDGIAKKEDDDEMPDIAELLGIAVKGKSKGTGTGKTKVKVKAKHIRSTRASKKRRRTIADSDEENNADDVDASDEASEDEDIDDDLSDFIVEDGEDEEEKDKRRAMKKRLGKRRASSPTDLEESGSESESDVGEGIVRGRRAVPNFPDIGPVKVLPKLLPSTKMRHMMDNLLKCAEEHPEDKTIVISQWTQCLDIVSTYLTSKDIQHVKFTGGMSREARAKVVKLFMKKDRFSVMLMSLKCGGVGLNLTRANRVINLDLGWSEAVENQAFDRVHRLGQHKDVFVKRVVIKDTVEDRVLALQEKKRMLADGSLGEGGGRKIGRLSVRELANLFGLDQRGNIIDNEN